MKAASRGPAEGERETWCVPPGSYLSRVSVLARQQGFAQVHAVGEFGSPSLDLGADPLVVLLQELHRRHVPDEDEESLTT